jgi:shikimate dehydrogenase
MHNAAFAAADVDAVFVALKVSKEELATAVAGLQATGVLGASVTVPHKQAVLDLCDRLEEPAASIGAVNCLVFEEDGTIVGHNTDAGGFVDGAAEVLGLDPAGKSVVILGGGGAARAVAAGLEVAGADEIAVVVRSPGKVTWTDAKEWTSENLAHLAGSADLLVDCTSRALFDDEAESPAPFPVSALHEGAAVVSLVYHRKPELLARAEERGLMVADGAGMLVHQGARAFRLWTGKDAPTDVMWQALRPDPKDRPAE